MPKSKTLESIMVACAALLFGVSTANAQISNADVIKTKADVAGTLTSIGAAPNEAFDLSAAGLSALKLAAVDDKVIVAMFQKKNPDINNQTILALKAAGVADSEIVRLIKSTDPAHSKLDGSGVGLIGLRGSGVGETVISAVDSKMNPIVDPDEDFKVLAAIGARITGGVIIGNGRPTITPAVTTGGTTTPAAIHSPQFSEASTYLAFESQPVFQPWKARGLNRVSLSPIFNTRLTTIAVAPLNEEVTTPTKEFLSSQKAVQFQFGGAVEYQFLTTSIGGSNFRTAVGPIGRFISQSITDSDRAVRIWNLQDDLYEAWTVGARLSLFREGQEERAGHWSPVAYIDFSAGEFENFETASGKTDAAKACLRDPASCFDKPQKRDDYETNAPARLYIESRVVLKYLYLGFDLNSGRGRDDVRFILGATVGLDRFFKR